jgi:GxxExxY protein
MDVVFAVHNELGRFLQEEIYQREIASRLRGSRIEVPLSVSFDKFSKSYFLDLLVDGAAAFELKTAERLGKRHRAQLLNYLLLSQLPHGKLINLRPDLVEHEFVNTSLTHDERRRFDVQSQSWEPRLARGGEVRDWLLALLDDVGAGLDVELYEEACTHYFGGPGRVLGETSIAVNGRLLGTQAVRFAEPDVAFKVTVLADEALPRFEDHSQRFLNHSALQAIHWINITREIVRFRTILRQE